MEIYLDNAASTAIDNEVREYMNEIAKEFYANPSATHKLGQKSNSFIENCRNKIANIIGCEAKNITFTGSASEANSMMVTYPHNNIAISSVEHSSIRDIKKFRDVHEIEVCEKGLLKKESLKNVIEKGIDFLSVIHASNETGTIQNIKEIREIYDNLLHVDAVQTFGKISLPWDLADSITISPHKFYGPKGIGILLIKDNARFNKLILGGNRERNRRGGTEDIVSIAGATLAIEKAVKNIERMKDIEKLRDYFELKLKENFNVKINGTNRIQNISNVTFDDKYENLIFKLDIAGIYASSGSACNSGSIDPSHVLKAMGLSDRMSKNSVRFSFSIFNTYDEVSAVINKLKEILK